MRRKKRESSGEGGREEEKEGRRKGGSERRDGGRENTRRLQRHGLHQAGSYVRLSPSSTTSLKFLFPLQAGGFRGALPCPELLLPGKLAPCSSPDMPSGTLGSGNTENQELDVPPSIPWQPTQYSFSPLP